MTGKILFVNICILFIISLRSDSFGQSATEAGDLTTYRTINSIGVEWPISGDDNHNAACAVTYRTADEQEYHKAQPLFRIDFNGFNMLAGSILFLDAATEYEIRLDLTDTDGGSIARQCTLTTRAVPELPPDGYRYFVAPGSGGGTGTREDPFRGIQSAQDVAQPGDVFTLTSGDYGDGIELEASGDTDEYIVWKAAPDAVVTFDGVRIVGNYIWLEGITIENRDYGLLTQSGRTPTGIVIKGNYFRNCHYSIDLNHGGENWYIVDNVIKGDIPDFTTGEMSGEGIELEHSNGHVVAYNTIFNTADGVSYPGKNCDIFRNEIYDVSDDGIEFDYGYANNRAWENRITTANNNGLSFQPMYAAPVYVIRNQVIVVEEDVLKLRDDVDRVLLANNTFVCQSGPVSVNAMYMTRFQSNNNIYVSVNNRYIWEDGTSGTRSDWRTNLDYDGFDWNENTYAFKWSGNRLETLAALQDMYGIEHHGKRLRKEEIFTSYDFPAPPASAQRICLSLRDGCDAIDAGIFLDNINEGYAGAAPDLGAFEFGRELPAYGVRINSSESIKHRVPARIFVSLRNHPDPFVTATRISYSFPQNFRMEKREIAVRIFDMQGREVRTLIDRSAYSGVHRVDWDGRNRSGRRLGSGRYLYRLEIDGSLVGNSAMMMIR